MTFFGIVGDALWIIAMAIICSTSRAAIARVPAEAQVPMQWGLGRRPIWRLPRNAAFTVMIGLPTAIGVTMLAIGHMPRMADAQLLVLGARALTASTMAIVHLGWLSAAMKTLQDEGALRG